MQIKTIDKESPVFFTGDLHFGHSSILHFANRPYSSVDEMNEGIIANFNEKIGLHDQVYVLGDITWKGKEYTSRLLDRLNGKKTLIMGNHDIDNPWLREYFDEVLDSLILRIRNTEKYYHLSHYPMAEWYKCQGEGINLHAHTHGKFDYMDSFNYQRLDVGLDCFNMSPMSLQDVEEKLDNRLQLFNAMNNR